MGIVAPVTNDDRFEQWAGNSVARGGPAS